MKKLKVIIIGCGNRGAFAYAKAMKTMPEKFEIVAIADPVKEKREYMKELFNLQEEKCFLDWKDVAELDKFADIVVVSTQDYLHYEPALAFIDKKYDLLLEKPMAPTPEECMKIVQAAEKNGVKVLVCHVLRYTPFFMTLKKIIDDGVIGKVMLINHTEEVGNVHQSHSYVRGNWRNTKESTPMILAKSCHDTDIIQWLIGGKCTKIQSFGTLSHFTAENAPEGATDRCTDGCPYADTCYYSAIKIYHQETKNDWLRPVAANKPDPTDDEVWEAIANGPYGKCVYKCDNNVVDHQTLNMEFEDGQTVVFTMAAFNEGGRHTVVMGTKGQIVAHMEEENIDVYSFADKKHHTYKVENFVSDSSIVSGHGGGDAGIVNALYDFMLNQYEGFSVSDARTSALNHLMCFAAEESRINSGVTIDMNEYTKRFVE